MSRIGRKPIKIPANVKINVVDRTVSVTGPLGVLHAVLPLGITLSTENGELTVISPAPNRTNRGFQGLTRALLANMIEGVQKAFVKNLEITGVGYKAEQKGNTLVFSLGYSHPVVVALPEGVTAVIDKTQTKVSLSGINLILVSSVAAEIVRIKKPDPYKTKGVKYEGQVIKTKAGKTGTK